MNFKVEIILVSLESWYALSYVYASAPPPGGGQLSPSIFPVLNSTHMSAAWKKSTSNGLRPTNRRDVAKLLFLWPYPPYLRHKSLSKCRFYCFPMGSGRFGTRVSEIATATSHNARADRSKNSESAGQKTKLIYRRGKAILAQLDVKTIRNSFL